MTRLVVRCAWHPQNFGEELIIEVKDGKGVEGVSDSCCDKCRDIYFKQLKAVTAK